MSLRIALLDSLTCKKGFACLFLLIGIGAAPLLRAQTEEKHRFMVFFRDKNNTPYTLTSPNEFLSQRALDRRKRYGISVNETDLPVNPDYVKQVGQITIQNAAPSGVETYYTSRWFNALLVQCDSLYLSAIKQLSFVQRIDLVALNERLSLARAGEPLVDRKVPGQPNLSTDDLTYQAQHTMLGLDWMHRDGYMGQGVWIALLDAGYNGLQENEYYDHLFQGEGRILDAYNFVSNDWGIEETQFGNHGHLVLACMASYAPDIEAPGGAFGASYALFLTEDGASENRIEEYNWLFAMERADSLGIDVVNSSLGYYDFDIDSMDYTHSGLNGHHTVVARAANLAAARGIVVVNSAGNEGNNTWRRIISPSDAKGVLSVGAVDRHRQITSFSSVGPSADGRMKPDVAAQGGGVAIQTKNKNEIPLTSYISGTSFSSPLMASFMANLKQMHPDETPFELYERVRKLGSRAKEPDNVYGYGIPFYTGKLSLDTGGLGQMRIYPNPFQDQFKIAMPRSVLKKRLNIQWLSEAGALLSDAVLPYRSTPQIVDAQLLPVGHLLLRVEIYPCDKKETCVRSFRLIKK